MAVMQHDQRQCTRDVIFAANHDDEGRHLQRGLRFRGRSQQGRLMPDVRPRLRTAGYWLCCLSVTVAIGLPLSGFRVPVGWLVAGLVSAGCMAVCTGREFVPHKFALRPAQGCIGVAAGAPLAGVANAKIASYLGISAVCSAATLILCVLCGFALARVAKTLSPATALLSTLTGASSGIATMAPELRVDHRYVALSQYVRVIAITLSLPLLLHWAGGQAAGAHRIGGHVTLISTVAAAAVIVGAGYAGLKWKWPTPFLLAPMLAILLIQVLSEGHFLVSLPPAANDVAFVVIGWQAGGALTRGAIRQFIPLLPFTCAFIGVAIGGCLALAFAVSAWTGLPISQAYLATTPGGSFVALGACDPAAEPIVATMQVFRLLVMNIAGVVIGRVLTSQRDSRPRNTLPYPNAVPVAVGNGN